MSVTGSHFGVNGQNISEVGYSSGNKAAQKRNRALMKSFEMDREEAMNLSGKFGQGSSPE